MIWTIIFIVITTWLIRFLFTGTFNILIVIMGKPFYVWYILLILVAIVSVWISTFFKNGLDVLGISFLISMALSYPDLGKTKEEKQIKKEILYEAFTNHGINNGIKKYGYGRVIFIATAIVCWVLFYGKI